jgi:hypothetical protein
MSCRTSWLCAMVVTSTQLKALKLTFEQMKVGLCESESVIPNSTPRGRRRNSPQRGSYHRATFPANQSSNGLQLASAATDGSIFNTIQYRSPVLTGCWTHLQVVACGRVPSAEPRHLKATRKRVAQLRSRASASHASFQRTVLARARGREGRDRAA